MNYLRMHSRFCFEDSERYLFVISYTNTGWLYFLLSDNKMFSLAKVNINQDAMQIRVIEIPTTIYIKVYSFYLYFRYKKRLYLTETMKWYSTRVMFSKLSQIISVRIIFAYQLPIIESKSHKKDLKRRFIIQINRNIITRFMNRLLNAKLKNTNLRFATIDKYTIFEGT